MINSVGVLMSLWLNNRVVLSFEMPDEVLSGKMTQDLIVLKYSNLESVNVDEIGVESVSGY